MSTGDTTIFYEWIGNTFICNTYLENNTLFVFEIIPANESASSETGTNYKVTAFNLQNSSKKEIMSGKYQNGTGDIFMKSEDVSSSEINYLLIKREILE
ncbi:MAG: hypothetical protein PHU31_07130 [Anaerotignum sp.]|nr:hypothetical protein [Anaerotignum sp.]